MVLSSTRGAAPPSGSFNNAAPGKWPICYFWIEKLCFVTLILDMIWVLRRWGNWRKCVLVFLFFFSFLYLPGISAAEASWVMWESGSSHGQSQFLTFLFSAVSALGTVCVVISRFSLWMQTGGGDDHTHTALWVPFSWHCAHKGSTIQRAEGFSGSFISIVISKFLYKRACFGKVSTIVLLGSHQMKI